MTLNQRLEEARKAYHALLLGEQAREIVDQNGERVTFTATNRDALRSYIMDLERQVAACGSASGTPSRGPMIPVF